MKKGIITKIILLNALVIILAVFITGCEKTPIPEDTLVKIYADLVVAREKISTSSVNKDEIDAAVFKKYSVTRKAYEESIKAINQDPKQWEAFFDKVIEHLQTLKKQNK